MNWLVGIKGMLQSRIVQRLQSVNKTILRSIRMSAMRRAEEALSKIKETNPYYEKYAKKIADLQQTSPEEFLERVDKVVQPVKKEKTQNSRTYSELLNPKTARADKDVEVPFKKLQDIMKVELIAGKNSDEIKKIWFEYHKTKHALAATLSSQQYDDLINMARKYPTFLLPLPRSEGFEFIMLQFASNTVHFTPLIAYQVHGENAPECLTLVYYTELRDKNVVLMRGEFDDKVLSAQEAQCLANELQMFYGKNDESKLKLLDIFTNKPDQFKHMDLIKEIENIQLV